MIRTFFAVLLMIAPFASADVPAGSNREISERLEPAGSVCRPGESCAANAASSTASSSASSGAMGGGKEIYDTYCFACHAQGMSDAPILGDAESWAPRIAKGMEELMRNTIDGINIMPPKGTCMSCSDEDLEVVVQYMIDSSQ